MRASAATEAGVSLPLEAYRVGATDRARLSRHDPDDRGPFAGDEGKEAAKALFKAQKGRLAELQKTLYADGSKALLVVLQALDAGGKDGTIRKVMTGMNPQGVRVSSFKAPSEQERSHDFLWRVHASCPARGMIGVFNRSHYEDVLIARVRKLVPKRVWSARFEHINAFERLLEDEGTRVLKIYLHIGPEEQAERFEARLEDPSKRWKFNPEDLETRAHWDAYRKAFEEVFEHCSSPQAPWYIVPANRKWYRNVVVAQLLIEALDGMKLRYPQPAEALEDTTIPDV